MAPFPPPPIVGRVHDMFILYSKNYRKYCKKFFKANLYRNRDFSEEGFKQYRNARSKLSEEKKEFFKNVWPWYETYPEFLQDMESPVVWISN